MKKVTKNRDRNRANGHSRFDLLNHIIKMERNNKHIKKNITFNFVYVTITLRPLKLFYKTFTKNCKFFK